VYRFSDASGLVKIIAKIFTGRRWNSLTAAVVFSPVCRLFLKEI